MTGEKLVRICVDGNEANVEARVGSNAYAYGLLTALEKITRAKKDEIAICVVLAQAPVADMPEERPGWRYQVVGPKAAWTQLGLPIFLFLHQTDFDVFFTPGHYAPRWCSIPYISSVMDLAFLRYPAVFRRRDLYKLENWTRYSVKQAAKIVTISEFSAREIQKFYDRAQTEIVVAYPALTGSVQTLTPGMQRHILKKLHISNNYFLYLGTLQPRKNIIRMIEAFEQLRLQPRFKNYQLVLAGKNGWLTGEIAERISSSTASNQIIQTGFVSERQKAALILNATATLNLGIYEGFGIPPLESLAYGTIPIVANNTSMPEAVGTAGLCVDPFSSVSIAKAMSTAAQMDSDERAQFYRLAAKQVKKFSYEKSATRVLVALLAVATGQE